jgi:hypothetical protein
MRYMVMTHCPMTGAAIETGIVCDWETFNDLAESPGRVKCPRCGKTHAWVLSEAWLQDHLSSSVVSAPRHKA